MKMVWCCVFLIYVLFLFPLSFFAGESNKPLFIKKPFPSEQQILKAWNECQKTNLFLLDFEEIIPENPYHALDNNEDEDLDKNILKLVNEIKNGSLAKKYMHCDEKNQKTSINHTVFWHDVLDAYEKKNQTRLEVLSQNSLLRLPGLDQVRIIYLCIKLHKINENLAQESQQVSVRLPENVQRNLRSNANR